MAGTTILVHGVLGAVGSMAAQLARWGGASAIGTVRRGSGLERVEASVAQAVALDARFGR
jgi:NADPH2:quinone reductase